MRHRPVCVCSLTSIYSTGLLSAVMADSRLNATCELGSITAVYIHYWLHSLGNGYRAVCNSHVTVTQYYNRFQPPLSQCYKTWKITWRFCWNDCVSRDMAWKQAKKPIRIISTGLPRPGLARSAHRLQYLWSKSTAALNSLTTIDHAASWSKSSAALNSLTTIDHTASLWEVLGIYVYTCTCIYVHVGPAHQLCGAHAFNYYTHDHR